MALPLRRGVKNDSLLAPPPVSTSNHKRNFTPLHAFRAPEAKSPVPIDGDGGSGDGGDNRAYIVKKKKKKKKKKKMKHSTSNPSSRSSSIASVDSVESIDSVVFGGEVDPAGKSRKKKRQTILHRVEDDDQELLF
jgi:hypothetical protein